MNYTKEVHAFHEMIEEKPLSYQAISLWHALFHAKSRAGWAYLFPISTRVLKYRSGLSTIGFIRARKELKKRGLIEYRSRGANKVPVYWMYPVSEM